MKPVIFLASLFFLAGLLISCTPPVPPVSTGILPPPSPTFTPEAKLSAPTPAPETPTPQSPVTPELPSVAYTYPRPDGNHLADGQGALPNLGLLDIRLAGEPRWVVGLPWQQGVVWAVALVDGQVQGFHVSAGQVTPYEFTLAALPAGMPPVLVMEDEGPQVLPPPADLALLSHPVLIPGGMAYVAPDGDLVVRQGQSTWRPQLNALTDGRVLYDGENSLLLLTDSTRRYPHGALGDKWEAGSITLVSLDPPAVRTEITLPEPWVVEGIAPLWADITGDGQREIILTRSSVETGAQIAVYSEAGELLGTGEAIGLNQRWRHVIAAAPFAPDGAPELVDVLTPHIGGPVEFFRWQNGGLVQTAQARGYTSHVNGTRNMDMAVAGDFDATGRPLLLLPSQARDALGAVRRTESGAEIAWTLPLDGLLVTNLSAVTLPDGALALAAARLNGVLRVWQPNR